MNWNNWEERDTEIRKICSKIKKTTGYDIINLPIKDKLVFQGSCYEEGIAEFKEKLEINPRNEDDVYMLISNIIYDNFHGQWDDLILDYGGEDFKGNETLKKCYDDSKKHLENTIRTINSFQNKETNEVILNDEELKHKRRIVVLKPNAKPEIQLVNDELENFQAIVGGYIQYVPMPNRDDIDIWCNEEGKLMGLKPNLALSEYGDCIVGTCYFCANDGERSVSLNKEQIDAVNKFISTHALLTDLDNEQE